MKILIIGLLVASAGAAHAQAHKCTMPSGKVEYMDTPCPTDSTSATVRTDRSNSIDTKDSHRMNKAAAVAEECDAAKLTLKFNDTKVNRDSMRAKCALPAPEPKKRTRVNCTGQSQSIGGGLSVGDQNCVAR